MQFYFLSIVLNALAGGALIAGEEAQPGENPVLPAMFRRETPRLVLGIATMVAGVLKLLSPPAGDLPVLGDLVPAAMGFFSGFCLVFNFYRAHATLEDERTGRFGAFVDQYRKHIGVAGIASAVLHFLFPGVLFL